jgi:hypothetical protein
LRFQFLDGHLGQSRGNLCGLLIVSVVSLAGVRYATFPHEAEVQRKSRRSTESTAIPRVHTESKIFPLFEEESNLEPFSEGKWKNTGLSSISQTPDSEWFECHVLVHIHFLPLGNEIICFNWIIVHLCYFFRCNSDPTLRLGRYCVRCQINEISISYVSKSAGSQSSNLLGLRMRVAWTISNAPTTKRITGWYPMKIVTLNSVSQFVTFAKRAKRRVHFKSQCELSFLFRAGRYQMVLRLLNTDARNCSGEYQYALMPKTH